MQYNNLTKKNKNAEFTNNPILKYNKDSKNTPIGYATGTQLHNSQIPIGTHIQQFISKTPSVDKIQSCFAKL